MKKFLQTLCYTALFLAFLSPNLVNAQEDPTIVRVGVYDNSPKIFMDEDGEIKGFWADIINYMAEQEGWQVQYVYGTWDEGLERLANNEIDIMVDIALSEERERLYDFNEKSVLSSWAQVYAREGIEINSFFDFQDKKIAILKSGIHFSGPLGLEKLLESFGIEVNYFDVEEYADVFQLLDQGEADIGVVSRFFGEANAEKYNIVQTSLVFNLVELRFAFPKNAPDNNYIIPVIDQYLKNMKSNPDSIYYQSIDEHFPGIKEEVEIFPIWAKWVIYGGGFLLLIAGLFIIVMRTYQRTLKREVHEQTAQFEKSEEKYRQITEASIDGIVQIGKNGKVIFANDAAARIWGFNKKEVLNLDFTKFVIKKDIPRALMAFKKVLNGESVVDEYGFIRKDKSNGVIQISSYPYKIKGIVTGVTIIARDITKKKEAEDELKNKIAELEKAMRLMTGREIKMTELKEEIKKFKAKQ
ncbi:transporter substrate-binding domain-containing protein [Patescibacteria group bacterium]|nr:transporter substrate-binding domain-containing protein [Patescibacteria group bacterium]MBU1673920.1 transporter substrate-binding domain-containing protein [Patescibacteria group bacterium]MBU1963914.1 transporter substrate-binding domain-containing protein [Patescibacteria group bacterium]